MTSSKRIALGLQTQRSKRDSDFNKRLFHLRQDLFHFLPTEGAQGLPPDVAERADFKYERAHRFVIRRLEQDDNIVSAHRPEFLHDLHTHFLRLSYRSFAALNCVFNVANTLVCKLNQPDISSHKCYSFPVVGSNRLV